MTGRGYLSIIYFVIVESKDTVLIPSSGGNGNLVILTIGVVVLLLNVVVAAQIDIKRKYRSV